METQEEIGYVVQFLNEEKGRGLIAKRNFKKGEIIIEEKPLASVQFSWNKAYDYSACDLCMRPLETTTENVHRLSGGSVQLIEYPEFCPTNKNNHSECEQCKVKYCSSQCQTEALDLYHRTLCYRNSDSSPFLILEDAWKKMHYPPETCSVMLLARIIAIVEQSQHKEITFEYFNQFCSKPNHDNTLQNQLGDEYVSRLEILRPLMQQCFPNATYTSQWFTKEGFEWLFTMVAVNGQGIGTSVFSQWVENVYKIEGNQENDQLKQRIDDIYSKLFDYSGCQFLNNEGSGLYKLQSSCNHNCSPNAQITFPYSNFVLRLVAVQDIPSGQEICISYLDEDVLQRGKATRNRHLREFYYFNCSCDRCESQEDDPESDSEESMEEDDDGEEEENDKELV